jgi:hypothetical protein
MSSITTTSTRRQGHAITGRMVAAWAGITAVLVCVAMLLTPLAPSTSVDPRAMFGLDAEWQARLVHDARVQRLVALVVAALISVALGVAAGWWGRHVRRHSVAGATR